MPGSQNSKPGKCQPYKFMIYSGWGAPTGQTSAQVPHSVQASAEISYLPSPSEMAEVGHSGSQAPHAMQSSLIIYAMETHLLRMYHSKAQVTLSALLNNNIRGEKINVFSKIFKLESA